MKRINMKITVLMLLSGTWFGVISAVILRQLHPFQVLFWMYALPLVLVTLLILIPWTKKQASEVARRIIVSNFIGFFVGGMSIYILRFFEIPYQLPIAVTTSLCITYWGYLFLNFPRDEKEKNELSTAFITSLIMVVFVTFSFTRSLEVEKDFVLPIGLLFIGFVVYAWIFKPDWL